MDVIKKITHLIALTKSTNENESRNAAVQACRLILEHGVVLRLPLDSHIDASAISFDDLFRKAVEDIEKDAKRRGPRRPRGFVYVDEPPPSPFAQAPRPPVRPPPPPPGPPTPVIRLKVQSVLPVCGWCGNEFPFDSFALSARGRFWHEACWVAYLHG